jgi:PEP-CTERM motif
LKLDGWYSKSGIDIHALAADYLSPVPTLLSRPPPEIEETSMKRVLVLAVSLTAAAFAFALPALAGTQGGGTTVPEPITLTLLAAGIGAVAVVRKFRKQ